MTLFTFLLFICSLIALISAVYLYNYIGKNKERMHVKNHKSGYFDMVLLGGMIFVAIAAISISALTLPKAHETPTFYHLPHTSRANSTVEPDLVNHNPSFHAQLLQVGCSGKCHTMQVNMTIETGKMLVNDKLAKKVTFHKRQDKEL